MTGTQVHQEPDLLDVLAGVADWARPFLSGDAPPFGTPEWLALPLDDPRRACAVVRAALSWWRATEPHDEVSARERAAAQVASSHAISAAEHWAQWAYAPTVAELRRSRDWHAQRDTADHPGRTAVAA